MSETRSWGEVEAALAQEYGINVSASCALSGESDATLLVRDERSRSFIVKTCPVPSRPDAVDLEIGVLDHLAGRQLGYATPSVVRTATGLPLVHAGERLLRVLTFVPGRPWRDVDRPSPRLLREIGRAAAAMVSGLAGLDMPGLVRTHLWDLREAVAVLDAAPAALFDDEQNAVLRRVATTVESLSVDRLPIAVVHQDLNDFNVLVGRAADGQWSVCGIIDVGDVLASWRVAELAVAAAYAVLRAGDRLSAVADVVTGFDRVHRLTDAELAAVVPLAAARLATNVATWTRRAAAGENVSYALDRMSLSWPALRDLAREPAAVTEALLRDRCGRLEASASSPTATVSVVTPRPQTFWVDLSPAGDSDVEPVAISDGSRLVVAGSGPRLSRSARRTSGDAVATAHLGVDVFLPPGEPVVAPWSGVVGVGETNDVRLVSADRPPLILTGLRSSVVEGVAVAAGDVLGVVVSRPCEVAAPPHVHIQLGSADISHPPTFVRPGLARAWAAALPHPAAVLSCAAEPAAGWTGESVLRVRSEHLASSQRAYYRSPMSLVRASTAWFTDEHGYRYLDAVNNVTHLGHGHPRVVAAAARQMRRLNTNSRLVYPELSAYCQRLTSTLPAGLDVVFLVCTGSEANDLALRIARTVTARQDIVVIDGAYHGNTTAVTAVSPNRYKGPGGSGAPSTTWEVPMPDRYRGPHGYDDADSGLAYAAAAADVVRAMTAINRPPAAVLAESLMGTAGQIVHPAGYLPGLFDSVRAAGGLCISDEVQVGFGRLGEAFWGFDLQEVVPDIVTMGKPIGNGHPLAAVVTTRDIADAFDTGMKYFNTYGGNPVSCAVGMAVLDVIEEEGLQQQAAQVGNYVRSLLAEMAGRHQAIGDVRGSGLYLGIDLVSDRAARTPAASAAYAVCERMRDEGVIVWPNGVHDNVLKVKPPLAWRLEDADLFAETLDDVLTWGW